MAWNSFIVALLILTMSPRLWSQNNASGPHGPNPVKILRAGALSIEVFGDGSYALRSDAVKGAVLRAGVGADLSGISLHSAMYPQHVTSVSSFQDELGRGQMIVVKNTGLSRMPELICELRLYDVHPWGDIRVSVHDTTTGTVEVQSIAALQSNSASPVELNGPESQDRVLSDSFSEDSPTLKLMNLGEPEDGLHRGFGSQLIYNRKSGESLFLGALSAEKFLTVFHLNSTRQGADVHVKSYDVDATGTAEGLPEQGKPYGAKNNVPLKLQVNAGESLSSERIMFAIGSDYHQQLENYGYAIKVLHRARVSIPTPIGWWSWTAFYYGVTEADVLTNAEWLAQNLESIGYRYFQVDEGYQYARGEYATSDGKTFPRGMEYVGRRVNNLGLTFGVWVAPFQVSERSWVYEHHRDWLVHNLDGEPIHLGKVGGRFDELYALDTTNPGAQGYLRYTYSTLVKEWGVRFIKMDFMDSSAVEGVYYRPNTTALEAQRIGLEVIRQTVGNDVVLDKDGSPMLTPVGIVDTGRISQDTGHTFQSSRDAASGIAARYYMNRNFYISDPDAFTVSTQTVPDRGWHGNKVPLTLDEAGCSIALAAVSGGMFEIGDDLPTLGASPERLALVRNTDLIEMAQLGRAATPVDLMSYLPADGQPSIFLLKEDERQRVLTVFNWTEQSRTHTISFHDLGLAAGTAYQATDILRGGDISIGKDAISITQPAHSVRILKLIDPSTKQLPPDFKVQAASEARAGDALVFSASAMSNQEPVLRYTWKFGDGVSEEGAQVSHAYTRAAEYTITVTAFGLDGSKSEQTRHVTITGFVPTVYNPSAKERFQPAK